MNAPAVSLEVFQRFHALRRRHLSVRLGIAISIAAASLLAIWVVLAASDYYWEWPLAWRKSGWIAGIAIVAAWLTRRSYVIVRETRQRHFAGQLENSFAEFGQRIRTVLETVDGRVNGPAAMLAALGHQTLGRWETSSPGRIVPSRTLMTCGGMCLIGIALTAGIFSAGDEWRSAMLRAVGFELPYTALTVTPGDTSVLEGSPVEVSLVLSGRTNRDVMLRYRKLSASDSAENESTADEAQWIESELLPDDAKDDGPPDLRSARFAARLGKAADPLEYQFVTSVGTTSVYRIDVQPLIEVQRIETLVEPPQYTRLETRSFASADVTVLEQSAVTVTIETNHPLREAALTLGEKPSKMEPVDMEPGEDRMLWRFELPSSDSLHWNFSGAGDDGTPMTPVKGRLRVRQDRPPTLAWRDPPDEIRVHTLAELPMRLQVSDDYGVSETAIVFQLGGDDEYVLTDWMVEQAEDDSTANTTRLRLEKVLPLESFSLSERDYISYYAYAVDNRAPVAHRSETDVRYIDIRPLRQFYSERERDPNAEPGDGGVVVQLDEIIRRQRFLINRTRKLVRSSGGDWASQLGLIDRMVESQSELAGLTRFLAEFFISRGNDDVEALSQAEAAMLQAADSLAAASFDLALAQEEDALRALAEARRTLEIFLLKDMTPQQRQALRQFARQLRQKLRRDRPETEQQIADTLKKIAAEQSQLGETAARLSSQQANPQGSGVGGKTDSTESSENREMPAAGGSQSTEDSESPSGELDTSETESTGSDSSESEAPTWEEQQDDLFASQVDLIERLQAIEDQLANRLADSPLMARRMEEAKGAMNELANAVREGELDAFSSASQDASEQLRELGIQLDALAASEAVTRVSAIRDMTTSLANMENELAERLRTNESSSASGGSDEEEAKEGGGRHGRRMQRRAETIEDVLHAPVDVGDVETSEVNDRLQAFVEENGFLEQLQATREASGNLSVDQQNDDDTPGQRAYDRAVEYADAAIQLDELYRQLVTPRLERLREIEQRADSLAQQMGTGGRAEEETDNPEVKAGIGKLKQDLEEEGLGELAELLDADAESAGPTEEIGMAGVGPSDDRFAPTHKMHLNGRMLLVVKELRERIQEMILLEISADRDAPIPPQYRTAVDQYLRVIAGDAEGVESGERRTESTDGGAG